ncbi:MAG: 4-vinyl reductase [Candidatus Methanomethylicia archaeon]|nr:4-vinyl reductase [Candidatus Methanomethylicia archaeon]
MKMPYPFDIGRYVIAPNRELLGLLIKKKDNIVELCSLFTSITSKYNIKVVNIIITYDKDNELKLLVFLDVTESTIPIERIILEIEKEFNVLEVIKSKGILIDTTSFPLMADNSRIILFRDAAYIQMFKGIRERFGSAGEAVLYYIGFESGKGFAKIHKEIAEKIGLINPLRIYEEISRKFFQWAGFGIIEIIKLQPNYSEIIIHDCFECEIAKNQLDRPYSNFVRGILAGIFTELFGTEFKCKEENCIAKGDKACKFIIYQ